jgi:RNA polymerase sigma-70 factor (ECF subfamily)
VEQLFAEHHQRVLRAAYRITGSMADAEDVAQSVFMRLMYGAVEPLENPGSYLYRAAINGALDLLRRRQSDRISPLEAAAEVATAQTSDIPDSGISASEMRASLRRALTCVSPRAAEMFVLRYLEDRDNREIAQLMHTSQAVVAVVLHQCRRKLKKQLQENHVRVDRRGVL